MAEETKILLPKIKKMEFKGKVMLDPADFRRGLPLSKLPELTDRGIILALTTEKPGTSRLTPDGSLKLNILYNAQVLTILGRYIEVRVIDDHGHDWLGMFLGFPVKGSGGEGAVRGCRVTRVEGNSLVAEAVGEAGSEVWAKLFKKVERLLEESN